MIRADLYGQMLYPTLEAKACAIAYSIITGHVFFDGNINPANRHMNFVMRHRQPCDA